MTTQDNEQFGNHRSSEVCFIGACDQSQRHTRHWNYDRPKGGSVPPSASLAKSLVTNMDKQHHTGFDDPGPSPQDHIGLHAYMYVPMDSCIGVHRHSQYTPILTVKL